MMYTAACVSSAKLMNGLNLVWDMGTWAVYSCSEPIRDATFFGVYWKVLLADFQTFELNTCKREFASLCYC
jgi:hypothetical protein